MVVAHKCPLTENEKSKSETTSRFVLDYHYIFSPQSELLSLAVRIQETSNVNHVTETSGVTASLHVA